ncbi:MAG: multiprotein bridging factor aMBF1 [archaeon]
MNCDICGKEENLFKTEIEGSLLNLCLSCSRSGKVVGSIRPPPTRTEIKKQVKEDATPAYVDENREIIQIITPDYPRRVQQAREKTGMKQKDFAKMIAEKESLLHSIETGKHKPSILLARKLEKALHITLVEQHEEKHGKLVKAGSGPLTIGDILIKKRKKPTS